MHERRTGAGRERREGPPPSENSWGGGQIPPWGCRNDGGKIRTNESYFVILG